MAALSLTDITNSIKNPKVCFFEPFLKNGIAEAFYGRPVCYSGNYGAVFKLNCGGETKAVRIWTKDLKILPELPVRSKILAEKIHHINSGCFVGFEFYEKGLLVSGQWTPIVVMDWCKGQNLKEAISNNLNNPNNLRIIANNFLEVVKALHHEGISHGDLQHGNILVNEDFSIKLIDYDSLYIPCKEFDNKVEEIKGLPDYQHPNRMQNRYANSRVDYFSELIIYLSLMSLAENPSIWKKFNVANKDYSLLFDTSDFADFKHSAIYYELNRLSEEIKHLVKVLEYYLSIDDINKLEPFDKEHVHATIISQYCTHCGHKFHATNDKFCIICGTQRI